MSQNENLTQRPNLFNRMIGHGLMWLGDKILWLSGNRNLILLQKPRYRHRISVSIIEETASERHWRVQEQAITEMVQQRDWMKIAKRLEEADSAQSSCPLGQRDRMVIMETFLEALMAGKPGAIACEGLETPRIDGQVVAEILALHAVQPQRYGLAAMAARALIAQNWDLRGEDYADAISDGAWARIRDNHDKAMTLLDDALRAQPGSAMLAHARLLTLPFCADGREVIINWFEDAVKADPGDTYPMNVIGNFLLPHWFGDYDRLDYVARRAVSLSKDVMGDGAYAAVYASALEMEPVPLFFIDMEKYATGQKDLIRLRGYDPSNVAYHLERNWLMTFWSYLGGMDDEDRALWDTKRDQLYQLCADIMRTGLRAIHPPSWRQGEAGALNMISMIMQDDLARGAAIVVDDDGVRAVDAETG